jgi:hypothetical protein
MVMTGKYTNKYKYTQIKNQTMTSCSEILYRSGPTQETSGNHPVDQVEPPRHGTHLRVRGQFPISTRLDTLVCPVETCAQPHSITQLQAAQKVNLAGYYTYYALLCNIVQFQCCLILLILEAWIIIAQVD